MYSTEIITGITEIHNVAICMQFKLIPHGGTLSLFLALNAKPLSGLNHKPHYKK